MDAVRIFEQNNILLTGYATWDVGYLIGDYHYLANANNPTNIDHNWLDGSAHDTIVQSLF